jgi:hypothetical protein
MRGFKDDFNSWRETLSPEEKALTLEQAQKEFDKKFRKSDRFSEKLPEEKLQSFGKILKKFLDTEAEDYKKNEGKIVPDYGALQRKALSYEFDWSLRRQVEEVDRMADHRFHWSRIRIEHGQREGKPFGMSSPQQEYHLIKNDEEAHKTNLEFIEMVKKLKEETKSQITEDTIKLLDEIIEGGVPPAGKEWKILAPQALILQIEGMKKYINENGGVSPEVWGEFLAKIANKYYENRDLVEEGARWTRDAFRSEKLMPGKTKADVLKEVWPVLAKTLNKDLPPLDEEVLAGLAEYPANDYSTEKRLSWGTAEKLYKSVAIDPFGTKFLLGIFETIEEANKAFDEWNEEFEEARAKNKERIDETLAKDRARALADDSYDRERILKQMEEARR